MRQCSPCYHLPTPINHNIRSTWSIFATKTSLTRQDSTRPLKTLAADHVSGASMDQTWLSSRGWDLIDQHLGVNTFLMFLRLFMTHFCSVTGCIICVNQPWLPMTLLSVQMIVLLWATLVDIIYCITNFTTVSLTRLSSHHKLDLVRTTQNLTLAYISG